MSVDFWWHVVGLLVAAVAGLSAAIGVLWRAYRGAVRQLIRAKQEHVRVLEALRRHVQDR